MVAPMDLNRGPNGSWAMGEATATDYARDTNYAVKGGPLSGWRGSVAGTVAGGVGTMVTPSGCSQNHVVQRVNDFLNFGGGLGKAAVIGAAFVADPILGVAASGGVAAFQQATGAGCSSLPATNTLPIPSGPATPGVPTYGAGGGEAIDLTPIEDALWGLHQELKKLQAYVIPVNDWTMLPFAGNPLFWVRMSHGSVHNDGEIYEGQSADAMGQLRALTADSRHDGESVTEWGARLAPMWNWSDTWAPDYGVPEGMPWGLYTDVEWGNALAIWPWDVWKPLLSEGIPAWLEPALRDIAANYRFKYTEGGEWHSFLGNVVYFMDTSMWRTDAISLEGS
jgi:hypothetical protein